MIDDLKGYFDFKNNNVGYLNMLFADTQQQEKYFKIFKEILKAVGASDHSELRSATEIRFCQFANGVCIYNKYNDDCS